MHVPCEAENLNLCRPGQQDPGRSASPRATQGDRGVKPHCHDPPEQLVIRIQVWEPGRTILVDSHPQNPQTDPHLTPPHPRVQQPSMVRRMRTWTQRIRASRTRLSQGFTLRSRQSLGERWLLLGPAQASGHVGCSFPRAAEPSETGRVLCKSSRNSFSALWDTDCPLPDRTREPLKSHASSCCHLCRD